MQCGKPIILFLLLACSLGAPAQDIDTLSVDITPTASQAVPSYMTPRPDAMPTASALFAPLVIPEALSISPHLHLSPYQSSSLPEFLYGSAQHTVYPGMMNSRSATLGIGTSLGPVNLRLWGDATQYAYFHGYSRHFGVGFGADWHLSDKWNVSIFGAWYSPVHGMSPAMMGFLPQTGIGGVVSYEFAPRWGIDVGVQAVRSDFDRRWHMQPIVMPYYKVNKNLKIGADIGGILYNLLYDSRHANPTIPPR